MISQRALVEQSLLSTHLPDVYPRRRMRGCEVVGGVDDDQLVFDLSFGDLKVDDFKETA